MIKSIPTLKQKQYTSHVIVSDAGGCVELLENGNIVGSGVDPVVLVSRLGHGLPLSENNSAVLMQWLSELKTNPTMTAAQGTKLTCRGSWAKNDSKEAA